jgi:hypothetical protein
MAAQRKYPEELRERAVKMLLEIRERDWKGHGELARVGQQLGVHDVGDTATAPVTDLTAARIRRRNILGGLIHEYERAA